MAELLLTSGQIAAATSLQERYVREWLTVMITGRTVDYDPAYQLYRLPAEHAARLTSACYGHGLGAPN